MNQEMYDNNTRNLREIADDIDMKPEVLERIANHADKRIRIGSGEDCFTFLFPQQINAVLK